MIAFWKPLGPTKPIAHTPGLQPLEFLPGPATPVSPRPQSAASLSRAARASSSACASVAVGILGLRPSSASLLCGE
eukprot:scaffold5980_cov145-Isochrysis_galbana.AAC.2